VPRDKFFRIAELALDNEIAALIGKGLKVEIQEAMDLKWVS